MLETFRPIPHMHPRYEASNFGAIVNVDRGRLLTPGLVRGVYTVKLYRPDGEQHMLGVARCVKLAFDPIVDAKQYTVKHIDDNLKNFRLDNLEWVYRFGENHGRAKLTEEQVEQIRYYHTAGNLVGRIAKKFGVSQRTVCGIVYGESWTHTL